MNRPKDSDSFEQCRKHIHDFAPALLGAMEQLVRKHPTLSGDLPFYSAMERMIIHAPPHYLPILSDFGPDALKHADAHDVERAKFFCFRSRFCAFPPHTLESDYRSLLARAESTKTQMSTMRRTGYAAAAAFYLAVCVHVWLRAWPPIAAHHKISQAIFPLPAKDPLPSRTPTIRLIT